MVAEWLSALRCLLQDPLLLCVSSSLTVLQLLFVWSEFVETRSIQPRLPAVEAWSPNHRTAREAPRITFLCTSKGRLLVFGRLGHIRSPLWSPSQLWLHPGGLTPASGVLPGSGAQVEQSREGPTEATPAPPAPRPPGPPVAQRCRCPCVGSGQSTNCNVSR